MEVLCDLAVDYFDRIRGLGIIHECSLSNRLIVSRIAQADHCYDGANLLCEMNASGTVLAANTWGTNGLVSRRVGTTSTIYAFDPQGSVAQRLDGSGNVVSRDIHDAYGATLAGDLTR